MRFGIILITRKDIRKQLRVFERGFRAVAVQYFPTLPRVPPRRATKSVRSSECHPTCQL